MLRLKHLRKQNGLSQSDLACSFGVAQNTISNWENGKRTFDTKIANKIANFFGVSVDYLLGREDTTDGPPEPSVPGSKWVPVLGTVPAGMPIEAVEDILDYEEISPQMAKSGDYFALKIKGQSMEPKISNGDVIIVRKQDYADNGDIAVVLVNGDEATVKRINISSEGIMLTPNNPDYDPMFFTNSQIEALPVTIIGKVVELRAKF